MRWFDWLSNKTLSPAKMARLAKLAANPFAQPDIRMREMKRLLDDGRPEAIKAVLRRFAVNAQGHIADEEEKKWLEDALVEIGQAALPPLREFITHEAKLTYALRAYERIADVAATALLCIDVLRRYGPDDHLSSEAKVQLVNQLSTSAKDIQILEALCPFLGDHRDDVCWAVWDILEQATTDGPLPASIQASIIQQAMSLLTDASQSRRVALRGATFLAQQGWRLPVEQVELVDSLKSCFFIDKKGILRSRSHSSGAA